MSDDIDPDTEANGEAEPENGRDGAPARFYDPSHLVGLFRRTMYTFRTRLDEGGFAATAAAMCEFLQAFISDDQLWEHAARIADDPDPQVLVLLDEMEKFRDQSCELLVRYGVDGTTAVDLASGLSTPIEGYQRGGGIDVDMVRSRAQAFADRVCAAPGDPSLSGPGSGRRRRRFLRHMIKVAGGAMMMVGGVAAWFVDGGIASGGMVIEGFAMITDTLLGDD